MAIPLRHLSLSEADLILVTCCWITTMTAKVRVAGKWWELSHDSLLTLLIFTTTSPNVRRRRRKPKILIYDREMYSSTKICEGKFCERMVWVCMRAGFCRLCVMCAYNCKGNVTIFICANGMRKNEYNCKGNVTLWRLIWNRRTEVSWIIIWYVQVGLVRCANVVW